MKYFAEVLANLNCVSLYVEVSGSSECSLTCRDSTTVVLSAPCRVSSVITLPSAVEAFNEIRFNGVHRAKFRLVAQHVECKKSLFRTELVEPPKCICSKPLSSARNWEELPSEYWAEMMDMWHCHKPHSHSHSHSHSHPHENVQGEGNENIKENEEEEGNKEYTDGLYKLAMEGFQPKPGLSYYSQTYYLVHASDLHGCIQGPKIYKWDLGVPETEVVGIQLKELVNAHAVFTFEINERFMIWVLNTNTKYTTQHSSEPKVGVKVGFGSMELREGKSDPEPVTLPERVAEALYTSMVEFNAELPSSVQYISGWKLACL